jgi:hypothetical protein
LFVLLPTINVAVYVDNKALNNNNIKISKAAHRCCARKPWGVELYGCSSTCAGAEIAGFGTGLCVYGSSGSTLSDNIT